MSAEPWRAKAWAEMVRLADAGDEFTSDDLIDAVGSPDAAHAPNAGNNVVGSLFREAAAAGLIVSDGRLRRSRQRHRKGGGVRIWRGVGATTLFGES